MQSTRTASSSHRVDEIDVTSDSLTSRAGLVPFVRYLAASSILPLVELLFRRIRKSSKGQPIAEIFKKLFLADGTSRHLTRFDAPRQDPGYAGTLESTQEQLLSSHGVKRLFKAFSLRLNHAFRRLLRHLFLWRLKLAQPAIIVLGLDTVVLDNDDARKRHGVSPTYKKVKGFQPLQLSWKRFVIDAIFRRGDKYSNHGDKAIRMLRTVCNLIWTRYRSSVPIAVRIDSGFFDEKLFVALEELGMSYLCAGRLYEPIRQPARNQQERQGYKNDHQQWRLYEFEDQRERWQSARRAIYSQPVYEDRQKSLEFAQPDTAIYTNLGRGQRIDGLLEKAGHGDWTKAVKIQRLYHDRGRDELVLCALKEFAAEKLAFKRFGPNMAYYFTGLVAFFLFEALQEDVCDEVVPLEAYPNTLRRLILDQAGKIVRHSGRIVLKVIPAVWDLLKLDRLGQGPQASSYPAILPSTWRLKSLESLNSGT